MNEKTLIEQLIQSGWYVWLGIIWWAAVYLNQVRKWAQFKLSMLLINIFLAWWIGWMAWEMIPDTVAIKNSLVSISWFLAYPILDVIEQRWIKLFIKQFLWKN